MPHPRRMSCHRLILCLVFSWLSSFATAGDPPATPRAPEALAGPWMQRDGDTTRIAVLIDGPLAATALATWSLHGPQGAIDRPAWVVRPASRPDHPRALVIETAVTAPGRYAIDPLPGVGVPRPWLATVPEPRSAHSGARVAVISGWNYPRRADLDRLAGALGGGIDLVVAFAMGLERRLGMGGWEGDIPLAVIGHRSPATALADLIGRRPTASLGVGVLGLPVADPDGAAVAIAHDRAPWQVLIMPDAPWDPSLLAPTALADAGRLTAAVTACARLRVPLMLAAGGAGLISEPLGTDVFGAVAPAAGGPRYLLATPSGDGLAGIDPRVAWPLDRAALVGIAASPAELAVAVQPFADIPALRLRYRRGDGAQDRVGPGWGEGDAAALVAAAIASGDASPAPSDPAPSNPGSPGPDRTGDAAAGDDREAILERLAWLPADALAKPFAIDISGRAWTAFVARVDVSEQTWLKDLPRRLADRPWLLDGLGERSAEIQRDAILRQLATGSSDGLAGEGDVAAASADPLVVRALLRAWERHDDREVLAVLLRRLRIQAAGAIPLDADPLIQHRLTAAVFDAPYLSPTPLRPLAKALTPRLSPLARGPIERFTARQGEYRR